MSGIIKKFELLCTLIMEQNRNGIHSADMAELCRECNAAPHQMDNIFYETFGLSGDEIITYYRQSQPS